MNYPTFGISGRPKVPWRWIIFGVVLSFATIAWFSHMILGGYRQASARVETLHSQMADQDWDGIYRDASGRYRSDRTEEENREMFAAINRKLGHPVSTKQTNIYVSSDFSGTTVTAIFETTFSLKAKATEHLTWTSLGGQFRLAAYDITSMDLVLR
jgi:hypothetical protein